MKTSESIENISKALVSFQSEMEGVAKGAENPFFHSKYADLPSILQAIKNLMKKNKLAVIQSASNLGEGVGIIHMITRLLHESGEWIETECPIYVSKNDPQSVGASLTYLRRYSLLQSLGLSAEDDDCETAMHRPNGKPIKDVKRNVQRVEPIKENLF